MIDFQLFNKIEALPALQRREISDIVDFLFAKYVEDKRNNSFQYANKGFIKVYSDFYEPLDDFN